MVVILFENSVWVIGYTALTFTLLYGILLLFGISSLAIMTPYPAAFFHSLRRITAISLATQESMTAIEAAFTINVEEGPTISVANS